MIHGTEAILGYLTISIRPINMDTKQDIVGDYVENSENLVNSCQIWS